MSKVKVGDIVRCAYDRIGEGVLYRVLEVDRASQVKIKPIFACFPNLGEQKRKVRELSAGWCTVVSIDDMRNVMRELEALIGGEMNRHPSAGPESAIARKANQHVAEEDDE